MIVRSMVFHSTCYNIEDSLTFPFAKCTSVLGWTVADVINDMYGTGSSILAWVLVTLVEY